MSGAARGLRHVCPLRAVRGPGVPQRRARWSLQCPRTARCRRPEGSARARRGFRAGHGGGAGAGGRGRSRLPAVPLWGGKGRSGVSQGLGWRRTECTRSLHAAGAGELALRAAGVTGREAGSQGRRPDPPRPPPPPPLPGLSSLVSLWPWGCGVGPTGSCSSGPPAPWTAVQPPRTWPRAGSAWPGVRGPQGCLCSGTGALPPGPVSPWPSGWREPGGNVTPLASPPPACPAPPPGVTSGGTSVSCPGSPCLPPPR